MPRDYTQSAMTTLVKDSTAARFSRKGYQKHHATIEIWKRLPEDLRDWFLIVMHDEQDPQTLRCSPIDKTDEGFFEIWRLKRDRDYPELNPDFVPPEEDDGGADEGIEVPPFHP